MNKFTYLEDKLKERISEAQKELSKKGPIYKKIGFIIGIMISIVKKNGIIMKMHYMKI